MYIMTSLLFIPLNNTSEFSIRESHHSQTTRRMKSPISPFNHIRESHHSQTNTDTHKDRISLTIFVNHITLKHCRTLSGRCGRLTIFVNHITLKPRFQLSQHEWSLTIFVNHITLKPFTSPPYNRKSLTIFVNHITLKHC